MINVGIQFSGGDKVDSFEAYGMAYISASNYFGAPAKDFETTTYAEEHGEHVDPRAMHAAFDYKVVFCVLASNSNLESANAKITAFNNDMRKDSNGILEYKQVAFYNPYKRVKIVGYPKPISEATSFYRDKKGNVYDAIQIEWTIRVNDPSLCDFNYAEPDSGGGQISA